MNPFKKLLLLILLTTHTPASMQAMQEPQLSAAVDVIVDKVKQHLISGSGSTSNTIPELESSDQGATIWRDAMSGLEIIVYAPALQRDQLKLLDCVQAYESEQLGWPLTLKPFVATLKNESGEQLCGATGKFCGNTLFLDGFGQPHLDRALFQRFMNNLEAFAAQNAASRIVVKISEKEASFIREFSAVGHVAHTQLDDLFVGGHSCILIKELEDKQSTHPSDAFVAQWIPGSDYFEKKELAVSSFFSSDIQKCQTEFNPEHQSTIDIGIIIRDKMGTLLGGVISQLYLTAKIPHMYLLVGWLSPSIRGTGLAKKTLPLLEAAAKQLGCVRVKVDTTSLLASWLFEKYGYHATYTTKCSVQKRGCSDNLFYIFEKDLLSSKTPIESAKIAIVTGASGGIGRAVATYLAKQNYHVVLMSRSENKLKLVFEEITQAGGSAEICPLDISDAKNVGLSIEKIVNNHGKIDLLFNSAGILKQGTTDISDNDLDEILKVNLNGAVYVAKNVATQMKKQKSGYIINVSSMGGKAAVSFAGAYAASKFGLSGYTEALAKDMAPYGVKVTNICPAMVATDMVAKDRNIPPANMIQVSDIVKTLDYLLGLSASALPTEILITSVPFMGKVTQLTKQAYELR